MSEDGVVTEAADPGQGHSGWVRISHWLTSVSLLVLVVSGVFILMVHPRLYWGEVGNDLMPALLELPISKNHQHGGWEPPRPFLVGSEGLVSEGLVAEGANTPVSASRTFEIFNQNGWARSLHFLAAWCIVVVGSVYFLRGFFEGHFRAHIWPRLVELAPHSLWREVRNHLRLKIPPASGGPHYGVLQKSAYSLVVFVAAPLMLLTGLSMSPAITAALPFLTSLFGGYQSARTLHFFATIVLVLFVLVHVLMVATSGFRRHMRAMTLGE